MDKRFLGGCLARGMSLPQIGALTGRDPSTVGYWVQKYGLVANGRDKYASKGGLTREQLEPLVNSGASLQQIADELDRSISTVRRWLAKHSLKTRCTYGRHRPLARAAREAGLNRFESFCRHHGATEFILRSDDSFGCRRCAAEAVVRRRRRVKEILVTEAGGRCRVCGYDRFQGALHFHHVDPSQKTFALSRKGVTIGIDKLREEAEKCILLCANCHAEVEAGVRPVP
jgi:hypothetical protein